MKNGFFCVSVPSSCPPTQFIKEPEKAFVYSLNKFQTCKAPGGGGWLLVGYLVED